MTEEMKKTDGWLDWVKERAEPDFSLPEGTIDAHCHVFGPQTEFPFSPSRKYTPGDAGKLDLQKLREHLGVSRSVIVQASCHGRDNSALLDALDYFEHSARGVVSLGADVTSDELADMHARGVRGVRFNFVKRLVENQSFDELKEVAAKIREFGWHIVLYFEAEDLPDLENSFATLDLPLVIDHLGRPDITRGANSTAYSSFLRFVDRTEAWVKVSCPERLTVNGPNAVTGASEVYTDVAPFARRLITEFPERTLWGTDWPHPNMKSHIPDDSILLNYIPQIALTETEREQLLVGNPLSLYWPETS